MSNAPAPLLAKIKRLIEQDGPIPLADYMHLCMADPSHGYYKSQEAIGSTGDFITAPEVSQMFGELIGLWCIQAWERLGSPSSFCLAELGPGNGTLMNDLLRAAKARPAFLDAAHVVLVESSDKLRKRQAELCAEGFTAVASAEWLDTINELPACPTLIIANEFLDVIPIRQYVKRTGKWHEVGVGVGDADTLQPIALPNLLEKEALPKGHEAESDGAIFEHAPAREAVIEDLGRHISNHGGAALFIDYGHLDSGFGDTFQAMKNHRYTDPFSDPGKCDLTSHVDFSALTDVVDKIDALNFQTTTQSEFLLALGLLQRAGHLGTDKSTDVQTALSSQVERLAAPEQMGDLFKVMAFANYSNPLAIETE